jgi:plastocyanin
MAMIAKVLLLLFFASIALGASAQNSEIAARVIDEQGRPVADAVVVAVPATGGLQFPTRPRADVVDQVDKEFIPKVQAVLVGTSIKFPNNDNVRHHVYSFSAAKRFELPLYAGVPAEPVLFDKPGIVVMGCNIHDWMIGYVYVSESPYFAKTGKDGKATLTDLPPRAYVLRVWHPQMDILEEATRKTVDAPATRRASIDWTLRLKPEVRVRRAPVSDRGGRY